MTCENHTKAQLQQRSGYISPIMSSSTSEQLPPAAPQRSGRLAGVGLRAVQPTTAPSSTRRPRRATPIPESLLNDAQLNADIALLPSNYSFEIPKTIWRIRNVGATRVALQMPEGLLMYATTISDILTKYAAVRDTVVLGDVTYGACCVDDLSARALGCDFLVHYAHSCLVPVQECTIPLLYIFVHIAFNPAHLIACLKDTFAATSSLTLVATIQFVDTAHSIRETLSHHFASVTIPQARPLSPAELLGCTSPTIPACDALIYIGDGRFHLESAMIANPKLRAFRYDPYSKRLSEERYAHEQMLAMRRAAVQLAEPAENFGVILGTLGRQGSPKILDRLQRCLKDAGKQSVVVLLSEISPAKIRTLEQSGVQAWVQIACPRLSIDWGTGYGDKPLLTPYEAFVALGKTQWQEQYPMDFYAKKGGEWTNYYKQPIVK